MFDRKLKQLRKQIKKENIDAVFISSVSNIEYLSGYSNFSKDEREAYILVGRDFGYIITDGRYTEAIKEEVSSFELFERGYKKSTEDLLKSLKKKIKSLGIEEDNLTVSEHKILQKHFKKLKHFNLNHLRNTKDIEEIKKIEKAAKLGDDTFEHILKKLKVGVSEKEIVFEIEYFLKKNGAEISFPPIVAFGKNSSIPHHQSGETKLKREDFVLLDLGAKVESYCSDMTRTIIFGKASEKQKKIYRTVLETQKRAVDFINIQIKLGKQVRAKEVDKVAREYIKSKGYLDIPHSLGHGIGLEVHEHPSLSPKSKDILKNGMVFSIEPGIYIAGFGGVRIEDLFVLEKDKIRQITLSPKQIIEI
ncbi:aminopeptidase P family protein [Candidatus Daviesbacteria bacterium]|nr:aminopeptidase P family protein [Candidatus Daviesbacteria bacterium]